MYYQLQKDHSIGFLPEAKLPFDVDFELCGNGAIDEEIRAGADQEEKVRNRLHD